MTDKGTLLALPYVSKIGFDAATTQSIILALLGGGLKHSKILFLGDCSQAQARNLACETALKDGFEWIFFVDSDADFPVDALARLKACDADIACADMWSRNWPSFRTVMRLGEPGEDGIRRAYAVPGNPTGVESVDLCGMHCTLVRTSLLWKLKKPWFFVGEHGEDANFCFKAGEIGATVKCDFGLKSGHWGRCRMIGQDFTRDARNQTMAIVDNEMMSRTGVLNLE